jgi:hypothetical protein
MAVAEIDLGEVAVKVLFADMEIAAVDPALEDREEAFDGVDVRFRAVVELARPFFFLVTHRIVTGEAATDTAISAQFIGHQSALNVGVAKDDATQRFSGNVLGLLRPSATAALYKSNDRHAISAARSLPSELRMQYPSRAAFFVDGIGLVGLNDLVFAAKWTGTAFVHRQPDPVHEEPSGFHAAAQRALDLTIRNTFLRRTDQVDGLKPDAHRDMARLKNRPHPHRKRLATRSTIPQAGTRRLAFGARSVADRAAVWTHRTIWPKPCFYKSNRGIFIGEVKIVEGGFHARS